jgi:hypothetical protein
MLFWLYGFIARVALGERLTPADRNDYRLWSAFFVLFPVGVAALAYFGSNFMDRASAFALWLSFIAVALVGLALWAIWARFVPAVVSLSLGIIVWAIGLWAAWHGKLGFR